MNSHGHPRRIGRPALGPRRSSLCWPSIIGAELEVARAEANAAARSGVAAPRSALRSRSPRVEHHSEQRRRRRPWSLGFEVEIPFAAGTRSRLCGEGGVLGAVSRARRRPTTWRVRGEVRAALLEAVRCPRDGDGFESEAQLQRSALALLERRLQAGYASARKSRMCGCGSTKPRRTWRLPCDLEHARGVLAPPLGFRPRG